MSLKCKDLERDLFEQTDEGNGLKDFRATPLLFLMKVEMKRGLNPAAPLPAGG